MFVMCNFNKYWITNIEHQVTEEKLHVNADLQCTENSKSDVIGAASIINVLLKWYFVVSLQYEVQSKTKHGEFGTLNPQIWGLNPHLSSGPITEVYKYV